MATRGNIQKVLEEMVGTDPIQIRDPISGLTAFVISSTAAPATTAGYCKGCIYIYTDATSGTIYKNTGTITSTTWTALAV